MKKNMTFTQIQKYENSLQEVKYQCKCGRKQIIPKFKNKGLERRVKSMKKRVLRQWVVTTLDIIKFLSIAILLNAVAWFAVRYALDRVIVRDNGELGMVQNHYGK